MAILVKGKLQEGPIDHDALTRALPGYDPWEDCDGFEYSAARAEEYIDWYPANLRHVKGRGKGEPFYLAEFQASIVANLFGWHDSEGRRRYQEAFVLTGKKNGKTAWGAATSLALMSIERQAIGRGELYQCASTKEQAALAFEHIVGFLSGSPDLSGLYSIFGARGGSVHRQIRDKETGAFWKCVSSDAGAQDGVSPALACIDELHRHKSPELCEVMQRSSAAQPEPLTIYTTTADSNRPESISNQLSHYGRQVMSGAISDARFLPAMYECDADCEWDNPSVWGRANPNLGVTLTEGWLRREAVKATENPALLNNFLRLHLNIVTASDQAWFAPESWAACSAERDRSGTVCFAGLDLSSHSDITALVLYFPEDHGVESYFFMPRARATERQRRDKVPYITWGGQGHLSLTDGNMIDTRRIRSKVLELATKYQIQAIGIDPWNAMDVSAQLADDGFEVQFVRQGYPTLSSPTKTLDALVNSQRLRHGGNPVLRWMASNVCLSMDPAGNIKPAKDKSQEKIDGIVALVMAIGQAASTLVSQSVYEERGMLVL